MLRINAQYIPSLTDKCPINSKKLAALTMCYHGNNLLSKSHQSTKHFPMNLQLERGTYTHKVHYHDHEGNLTHP